MPFNLLLSTYNFCCELYFSYFCLPIWNLFFDYLLRTAAGIEVKSPKCVCPEYSGARRRTWSG